MVGSTEIQSPYVSESTANDDHQVAGFRVSKCTNKGCLPLACYSEIKVYAFWMTSFSLKCILKYSQNVENVKPQDIDVWIVSGEMWHEDHKKQGFVYFS